MIVCGKCGFTQPKDVYCANCGVNLEKYKPERPPTWVRILKDPLSQITIALISAVAVFFIIINSPSEQNIATNSAENIAPESLDDPLTNDNETSENASTSNRAKTQKKKPNLKVVEGKEMKANLNGLKKLQNTPSQDDEGQDALAEDVEVKDSSDDASSSAKPNFVAFSFFEITPTQLEKYFPSSARVQASLVKNSELNIQTSNFNRIPIEGTWDLTEKKLFVFDYMLELIDGSEAQGIKVTAKNTSNPTSDTLNISLRVSANIPSQDGKDTSIDWSRSINVPAEQSVLVKIRLPDSEPPASFLEENFNSPLSIMANPQYLDQKLQLLIYLKM